MGTTAHPRNNVGSGRETAAGGGLRACFRAILGLLAAAATAATCSAVSFLHYEDTITLPRELGENSLPVAVTTSADGGEVCVTDAGCQSGCLFNHHRILVFVTGAIAGLSNPMDMTVDGSGGLVYTDSRPQGGRTIRRLNLYGEPVAYTAEAPVENWQPDHLLITRDGNFITTDPTHGMLAKHDGGTGALLWMKRIGGTQSGELLGVGKPAEAPDGSLYVPLGGDRTVAVLSADGEPQTSFGIPGDRPRPPELSGRGRLLSGWERRRARPDAQRRPALLR